MTISIIIPSYNGRELLEANLPEVVKACDTANHQCEIIVVDDGSYDDTATWLKKNYPKIKIIRNIQNLRFARSINRGVTQAKGEIVVLLNNDVRPEKNFLKPIMKHFEDDQVFAVGCLEENLVNKKKILGGRGEGKFSRGFLIHNRAKDQNRSKTLWVAAGSGAFRKSTWKKLGGLDPIYRPAYEEDRDLSYTALKAGFKLVFEFRSKVEHFHETTNTKTFGQTRIKIMSFKNQLLFAWKNLSGLKLSLHLIWLPYHLVFTTIKSKGLFLFGFVSALTQIFEVIRSRHKVSKLWQLSDEQVLAQQN